MCILFQFSHTLNKDYCLQHVSCLAKDRTRAVPDLPFCLGVLKHRAPLAWGGGASSCQKIIFTMDFCLCGEILTFPEHVCLTAYVELPGVPPSVQVRDLIT